MIELIDFECVEVLGEDIVSGGGVLGVFVFD